MMQSTPRTCATGLAVMTKYRLAGEDHEHNVKVLKNPNPQLRQQQSRVTQTQRKSVDGVLRERLVGNSILSF